MKRLYILLFLLCLLGISLVAQSQDYYWYKGKQIPLQRGNQRYILYIENEVNGSEALQIVEGGEVSDFTDKNVKWGIVNQQHTIETTNIVYQMPSFLCSDTTRNMFVTHHFYVKLKKSQDINLLQELGKRYDTEIERKGAMPLWYVLRCGLNSKYDALQLSNIFYESGLFAATEPEFIHAIYPSCVNDEKFSYQWNLKNTGQYGSDYSGIDINYCAAHSLTTGLSNVIIGLVDWGVDLSHPDLNTYSISYNAHTSSSPSVIYGPHGTACAGVISAKSNNNIGVAGIAPGCPIMSISINSNTVGDKIAEGIDFAVNHGCAIISNSWSCGYYSEEIEDAFDNALNNGRNGKGCVVVFATGNNNSNLSYPADSNPDILTVGAISPDGNIKTPNAFDNLPWGSNYGLELDVMAPGIFINTTDIVGSGGYTNTNYASTFYGTSAACPHAAAIAGLILSVNPYLTQKEVADIIESTAQKVGDYMYTPQQNRPNGDWNLRMGYGLVDAYEAVKKAKNLVIGGPESMCDTAKYYLLHPLPTGESVTWSLDNGSVFNPHYTIVGPTNQDTVLVVCTDYYVLSSMRDGNEDLRDPILPHWDTLPAPLSNNKAVIATIVSDSTRTYTKALRHAYSRKPVISGSSSAFWPANSQRTFTVTNCPLLPDSAFYWTIMISTATNSQHAYGRTLSIFSPNIPAGTIRGISICVENLYDKCGNGLSDTLNYIVIKTIPLGVTCSNDHLLIEVPDENGESQYVTSRLSEGNEFTLELWHSIYGCVRILPVYSGSERIDIAGLPKGTYVLLLKENGDVISDAKILIQ